jgi:hypothetical protein
MSLRDFNGNDPTRLMPDCWADRWLNIYLAALTPAEVQAIYAWVSEQFDQARQTRQKRLNLTASVGSDWNDTPLQALYDKAARRDFNVAALLIGNIYARVTCRRPEAWITFQQHVGDHTSRSYLLDPSWAPAGGGIEEDRAECA